MKYFDFSHIMSTCIRFSDNITLTAPCSTNCCFTVHWMLSAPELPVPLIMSNFGLDFWPHCCLLLNCSYWLLVSVTWSSNAGFGEAQGSKWIIATHLPIATVSKIISLSYNFCTVMNCMQHRELWDKNDHRNRIINSLSSSSILVFYHCNRA